MASTIAIYIHKSGAVIPHFENHFQVHLVHGSRKWGMVSVFVNWDIVFQIGTRHESFFTRKKRREVVGSLVPLIYTMTKEQDCIINV